MIPLYQRLGVIDVSGTVALAVLHTVLAVSYAVPGIATGVYAPTPGRVSVVSYIDQLGPIWTVAFGVTAVGLLCAVRWTNALIPAHAVGGGAMAIFTAALWFSYGASNPRPTILTALFATTVLLWHVFLAVTYSAARSLPVRAGGRRRQQGEA